MYIYIYTSWIVWAGLSIVRLDVLHDFKINQLESHSGQ